VPTVAPYGSWESPISAESAAAAGTGISSASTSGSDVYWLESRPAEQGRAVLVRCEGGGEPRDLTPAGFSVRTSVHEYGGGAYFVDGTAVVFSNWADQRLWIQEAGGEPRPITPEPPRGESVRYADGRALPGGLAACVRETHGPRGAEVLNDLVVLDVRGTLAAAGDTVSTVSGHDFFAAPRPSPDGTELAWISWDHPNMPWDGTDLWVAPLSPEGAVGEPAHVAGGPHESVVQPVWTSDGTLWYVSDRNGWWNLYRRGGESPVVAMEAEFAVPPWVFGTSNYAELESGVLACVWSSRGVDHLGVLDAATGRVAEIELPYTSLESVAALGPSAVLVAASPSSGREVVSVDPETKQVRTIRPADPTGIDPGYIALPEPVSFPSGDGEAHGLYYPPVNPGFTGPEGSRPPLVVMSHGGPTGAARPLLNLSIQYWTSRGIAVVDVNYRGSSGYGREFRHLLDGQWGVLDVEDCKEAAEYLVRSGRVDGGSLLIRGGSAGGFTTLAVLTSSERFAAGAVYYGVADLEALATDTHKFESRYLDGLIGPYPERRDLYVERSPLTHADALVRPIIWFQGDEDKVVPPAQAEAMIAAMRERGTPHAYVVFEGEQHGFRKASSIVSSLEAELSFYGQVLGFEPAGGIPRVPVEGLTARS
jgi:dipeptidyl aminopeptidase/acylaminoacyl peptidase